MSPVHTPAMFEAIEEIMATRGVTAAAACRLFVAETAPGLNVDSLKFSFYQRRRERELGMKIPDVEPPIPEDVAVPYTNVTILADLQLPYSHTLALTRCLMESQDRGIDTAVLLGDVIDNDAYSTYLSHTAPQTAALWQEHVSAIYALLTALCGVYRRIYWVRGNHDARLMKVLGKRALLRNVAAMFLSPGPDEHGHDRPALWPRFEIVERYYMTLKGSPTGDWRLSHQRNYSTIPGRVAQRMAAKYRVNYVTSHEHGIGLSHDGTTDQNYAVACPALCDPRKLEYKVMRDTLNPEMVVGWAHLVDGHPEVIHYAKRYGGR